MPDNSNNSKPWLVKLIFFISGFFLLLAAQESCYKKGEKISAVVVAKEYHPGRSRVGAGRVGSNSRHIIRYRFTSPQGEAKEGSSDVLIPTWNKLKEGDSVNIEYLPATGDSRVADQTASASVYLLIAAVLLAGGFLLRRAQGQSNPDNPKPV